MFGSINPTEIWKAHIDTFRDFHSERWLMRDLVFVFGSPLLIAAPATWGGVRFDRTVADIFVTSLSIFAGLLFNLLVLAHRLREKITREEKVRSHLLKSAYANISFSILLSVLDIFVISAYALSMSYHVPFIFGVLTLLTLYLSLVFLLTLLIVLKRFHSLLWGEMKAGPNT
jgi:hypothetical protein